ncbi:hypothetical protein ENTCAN_08239 [Enterobacter cancerogenus ATCC 35316]|nr:hypothetical protein ENTCAN_08239 [Enterobacter cancerogenus ATCC 35316]
MHVFPERGQGALGAGRRHGGDGDRQGRVAVTQGANQRDRRQRFTDRNGMQQNTVRGHFITAIAIAFSPAFTVRRRFTATKQQSQPHQWLNDVEQGGIQQFQAIIRFFSFGGQILSI